MEINNSVVIQFFQKINTTSARNQYDTITFPIAFNVNYNVVLCSIELDILQPSTLPVSNSGMIKVSMTQCSIRLYGHGSADVFNGYCGICIGY